MKPEKKFLNQDKPFWAHVRTLSQAIGYTVKESRATKKDKSGTKKTKGPRERAVKVPTLEEILEAMDNLTLAGDHLVGEDGVSPLPYAKLLIAYFQHRADVLNNFVQRHLQYRKEAEAMYKRINVKHPSQRAASKNKQKGEKATVAFLTATVNLLVEAHCKGVSYDHNPMQLTTVTKDGKPLRTLSRRVDGAFPSVVNPIAIWEIKEYYNTTSFGSRVADGVYETMLDGSELEEMRVNTDVQVEHILIIDAKGTWWDTSGGPAYLCRIVDMLHMGYVDEVLFGAEIEDRIPKLVGEWMKLLKQKQSEGDDKPRPHGQTPLV